MDIKNTLDQQLREKKQSKEVESRKNKEYVEQIIARDEREKAEIKDQERQYY